MKGFGILFIFLFLLTFPKANAQVNNIFLGIYPPLIEVTVKPPADVSSEIRIENKNKNSIDLNILIRPFKLSDKGNGSIEYLPNNTFTGKDPSILEKIKVLEGVNEIKSVSLKPFETKLLNLKVLIDENSPASDYYFSILFVSKPQITGKTSTSASVGIGTNLILSVGDTGKAHATIADFSNPRFILGNTVPFTLLVENTGDRLILPEGKIEIKDMFGRIAGEVTILKQHILAKNKRYISGSTNIETGNETPKIVWRGSFLFGFYEATSHIKIDNSGSSIQKKSVFFAVPLYLLFALSFMIFLILSIYIRVKRKLNKSKRKKLEN